MKLIIKIGAAYDTVTVERQGRMVEFDRAAMRKTKNYKALDGLRKGVTELFREEQKQARRDRARALREAA